ncbi:MAG: diacylglycerol kinase family lipid kinase [Bacteroidia bacterium]|nr:diacylglycerol kinase family lipid kinase [Bacteroidia bacterium]
MKNAWFLVVNPVAGGGLNLNEWNGVIENLERLGISHEAATSEAKEHIYHLVKDAIYRGYRNFLAVGGDGTLHDVLNGLLDQAEVPSTALTITSFPVGSGCDWSKMYGIKRNAESATQMLLGGKSVPQDIGLVTYQKDGTEKSRYFINVAGLGYDAFVVEQTKDQDRSGTWAQLVYLTTALNCLSEYEPQHTRVFSSNFEKEGRALFTNVGLCKYSGGGMRLVPKAMPHDGLFDVTFMEGLKLPQVLLNLIKLYNGNLYKHKKAHHYRAGVVNIIGKEPILLEADGELLGTTPARFELIPGAIQVRVPSSYKG